MTNPRTVIDGKVDLEATRELRNREPLTTAEIEDMLSKADRIENEYFKLRVKALISIVKKFEKRRSEIATIERSELKVENGKLLVTFTIRKKHKRGLFQYFKWLAKHNPHDLEKPLEKLKLDWKFWTQTETGYKIREHKRTSKDFAYG